MAIKRNQISKRPSWNCRSGEGGGDVVKSFYSTYQARENETVPVQKFLVSFILENGSRPPDSEPAGFLQLVVPFAQNGLNWA